MTPPPVCLIATDLPIMALKTMVARFAQRVTTASLNKNSEKVKRSFAHSYLSNSVRSKKVALCRRRLAARVGGMTMRRQKN